MAHRDPTPRIRGMMKISQPDATIWFEDHPAIGEERGAVVFVHAVTGSRAIWAKQLPAFTEAGYRCIAYDLRGRGRSRPTEPVVRPEAHTGDLAALIEHLSLQRYAVVSMAYGGFVALEFAACEPVGLAALVVANSVGSLDTPSMHAMITASWSPEILQLPAHDLELSAAYRAAQPEGVREWRCIHDEAEQPGVEAPPMTYRNTPASLARVAVPTLFLAGDADLLAPRPIMAELSRHVAGAELEVIPGSGHASAWEQPERFNNRVLAFLTAYG